MRSADFRAEKGWRVRRRGAGLERWRALGRLLPREIRERVFDPAFSDLLRTWVKGRGSAGALPFGLHALGTFVGCVPIAVPRLFIDRGRLTRLGRVSLISVGLIVLVVLVMNSVYDAYASAGG